ncbi:hypothetical protein ZYGR_0A01370 [Zygosaccharomyces rouxii]|uniref:ZYRO0A03102p n=2 Tax=Zygosaccharomyces rouxii TaxID=4956 RepID=C5DPG1_ZYGRC|nr:uncharacterized protein ZYRO0A03102g [Zygosaccharomyces rouxii]KAH9198907.1 mate-domain-containing protein [Zygosaccharomyces rouxii]GAV46545.1 hypothetical protein ZYGR_0A01370 [Zygosaccharomyces rouxii]CAR25572.1 ZYRO0A03102p [Zygosaccharomyces rouxii]
MVHQQAENETEDSRLIRAGGSYGACPCDELGENEEDFTKITTYFDEFIQILRKSLPLALTLLLQNLISSVSLLFVGRLGSLVLGSVTLANVIFNATAVVFLGLATCLDTLCPQAYGAGNYTLVGLYFQRCIIISTIVSIPISFVWIFSKPLLNLVAKDAELINISSQYLKCMVGCIPGYIVFECGKKYMQAQGDFHTAQMILLIGFPFSILANYIFILNSPLGYLGAPLASSLTFTLMGILMACAMLRDRKCWHEFHWKTVIHGWEPLIRLAVPGIIMIEAEFLAFESLTVLAARFETTELASQAVATSVQSISFQIPFAVSIAASNRISTHVGRGKIPDCQIATRSTLFYMGPAVSMLNLVGLLGGRYFVSSLFTSDPAVIQRAAKLISVIAINQIWDAYNVLGAGCLRAQGRQNIGGYLNLVAYYVFGMPLAIYLGFYLDWQAFGFWIGLGFGIFALAIGEMYCVYRSDWPLIMLQSELLHGAA